ncbi:MAG TPA: GNAT family N-acetyltransferase [Myxococcaceae bacterium]|nr:GNAT family N-acetyltransferase [Myxococcaceae bacterium]
MQPHPHLRPVTEADDGFLFELYASTRAEELAAWGLDAAQQEAFLRMQWLARKRDYEARFPDAAHHVVEVDGYPAGRLLVARQAQEVRLVDIALLPRHRGTGVGTVLLRALQEEAAATGRPLRLQVARDNPAARLYARLGFLPEEGSEADPNAPYLALEWSAPDGGARGATS